MNVLHLELYKEHEPGKIGKNKKGESVGKSTQRKRNKLARLLKKVNFKCEKCGSSKHLTLHHRMRIKKKINRRFKSDYFEKGVILCSKCHKKLHDLEDEKLLLSSKSLYDEWKRFL